jgi:iron complex outermembrane receptor protein
LSAQSPRNPVAQLLQTLIKELMIGFGNFELDYKLHFFPALRAVVNAGFDQSNGERKRLLALSSGASNDVPFGTNEFSKVKKQVAGCLFSVQ